MTTYERSGRALYEGLAEVVANILKAAIAQDPRLGPQQFQQRAKEPSSLRQKLKNARALDDAAIEPLAKDLAGARVIFYSNTDVGRFQSSGIISENFEVDWSRTKFHHTSAEDPKATELFDSNNYVVRLKDERTKLPEYARFAGLWCEIQVQTTLNHAWAEMAHDTIYKKPKLSAFGVDLMEGIELRMKTIMRDYLAPAGYAFQKVLGDFDRLAAGQTLFDQGIIAAVEKAVDNNELHETLEKIYSSVLPHCEVDDSNAKDILNCVALGVVRARKTKVRVIDTPFGNFPGKAVEDVCKAAAEIIRYLRFVNIEHTFKVIFELYAGAVADNEKKLWIALAEQVATNDLNVWQQAGPLIQEKLVARIQSMSAQERQKLKPLILAMMKKVFSADLEGTTWNFDSVTLHRGAITPSDTVRQMRRAALQIVHSYDAASQDNPDRRELIDVYTAAMAMPHVPRSQNHDLAEIVFENSAEIIRRFAGQVENWSYEQRQKTEHNLLWQYRHYGSRPQSHETSDHTERARLAMVSAILAFRDRVNSDEDFTTYKLLVGYESVFRPAWDNAEFDDEEIEAYRNRQVDELIATISKNDGVKWLNTIRKCAATESNDLATFPPFDAFLEKLAHAHPKLVLGYFSQLNDRLAKFLPALLRGLGDTQQWSDAEALLRKWIAARQYLSNIGWAVGSVNGISASLVRDLLQAAIDNDDKDTALSIICSIAARDNKGNAVALRQEFLDAVTFMSSRNDLRWTRAWWSIRKESPLMASLRQQDLGQLIDALVSVDDVDSNLERFLTSAAKRFPDLVVSYFGQRLEKHFSKSTNDSYRPIPYSLDRVRPVLLTAPKLIVQSARKWFDSHPELFRFYGGKFVHSVFPEFHSDLEAELRVYAISGKLDDARFVVQILQTYSGEDALQSLCKDIIAQMPQDDQLLESIECALMPSGITSGEFGRVKRLKHYRASLTDWASDPREPVQSFALRLLPSVDNTIATEQRRGEESLALRKLEYDKPSPSIGEEKG